jgi:serine/threonine protein kinase
MGSNSIVYRACRGNNIVAVKMLKQKIIHRKVAEQEMQLEFLLLSRVNHPNIIGMHAAGKAPRKFIEVDYLAGGTLDEKLRNRSPENKLNYRLALSIAKDLASALKYLHDDFHSEVTIIHRDLKPHNIGFTADGTLKLFDFGLVACVRKSTQSSQEYAMTGYTGTMAYMAPEVALRQHYNEKVDVYSFGIVLWQILSGETPFISFTSREEFLQHVAVGGLRPPVSLLLSMGVPVHVIGLVEQCWSADPKLRPSFARICQCLAEDSFNSLSTGEHGVGLLQWARNIFGGTSGNAKEKQEKNSKASMEGNDCLDEIQDVRRKIKRSSSISPRSSITMRTRRVRQQVGSDN